MKRGVGLLILSILLAWASIDTTRKSTILDYRDTHPLPSRAWRSLLEQLGYHRITDTALLSRIIQSGSAPGSARVIGVSPDRNLLLLPALEPDEGLGLWRRGPGPDRTQGWSAIPFALSGFETLAKIQEFPTQTQVQARAAPAPKKAKWIDPKAFHY